ncbi:helix-turn-helix domain-containing protein [Polaribacter uvawellassae]|uniref:helix-turn-helix domain-containing protein n=1 Tax=Polaribacter uvawellassae TaxID=3133495 RepID=UPI0032191B9A
MNLEVDKLFCLIKQKLPDTISFIDEIADVLNISYDAMYRRINGKTMLSFSEALKLAKHFKISLNCLYDIEDKEIFHVLKRGNTNSLEGLATYFNIVTKSAKEHAKFKSLEIFYAAKDLPLYYLPPGTLFTKFRLFVFSNVHFDEPLKSTINFKDFVVPEYLIAAANEFSNTFRKVKLTEIWNDTTMNATLYQIYYFFELNFIDKEEALELCNDIINVLKDVENEVIKSSTNKSKYNLYYNKLINLNNTVYLKTEKTSSLIIPYTRLSYFRVDDEVTCKEVEAYLYKQLQYSKKISNDTNVERQLFFSSMTEKVVQLQRQIEVKSLITFM